MSLIDDKRTLRSAMLAWRGALSDDERRAAADGLLTTWQRELPFETPAVEAAPMALPPREAGLHVGPHDSIGAVSRPSSLPVVTARPERL